jgi:hypothetical protein
VVVKDVPVSECLDLRLLGVSQPLVCARAETSARINLS